MENFILNKMAEDIAFFAELLVMISCFIYFWFSIVYHSFYNKSSLLVFHGRRFRISDMRSNYIRISRVTGGSVRLPNGDKLYKGIRVKQNTALSHFHQINSKLRVGSLIAVKKVA